MFAACTRAFQCLVAALALAACADAGEAKPRWSTAAIDDLITVAAQAPLEGLPSEEAAISELEDMRSSADVVAAEQTDFLADALFNRLAASFARGAANPARADPSWHIPAAPAPDTAGLRLQLEQGALPSALLQSLLPPASDYAALRAELARVRAEAPDSADADGRTQTQRISSLRASMERWRWLPRAVAARRIEAHIAQFEIVRFDTGAVAVHTAIVGARRTQTPSFAADVVAVTLNPYWVPPASILLGELAPAFHANPAAAASYEITDRNGRVVDAASVNWRARPLAVQVRQRPGPANALGQLKFEMPNPFDVYLHDTPSRRLFERDARALSHGCIRVQDPVGLAAELLGSIRREDLEAAIASGATETRPLAAPVPFLAIYMTATVGADGRVLYANDIYDRDRGVVALLDAPDVTLVTQARSQELERCVAH
ncbi:L,D-transpeptidase family protein [Terricaulis sp.]|uniref:L,D-transpeptidase family protein n=1 Tax=Terricaulis sp. TaxID=2768686 RepID=UPI003784D593